jgi:DNA-directed RNA polymerase
MGFTEHEMKKRGESKIWSHLKNNDDEYKNVYSTQLGIKILFDDALKMFDKIQDWIEVSSASAYRKELNEIFKNPDPEAEDNNDIILEKIVQTLLFLSGTTNIVKSKNGKSNRHKKVNTLRSKIMPEASFETAWRFIETVIDLSEHFNVERMLNYDKDGFKWSFSYTSALPSELQDILSVEAAEAFYPMPMLSPPLEWELKDGEVIGGYKSFQYQMVRASRKVNYTKYSKKVFNSINYIQSIPWRINETILNQVIADLKMPSKEDFLNTNYPDTEPCRWDIKLKEVEIPVKEKEALEKIRSNFRETSELYNAEVKDFKSALGKYRSVKMATEIAKKYIGQTIYFPHSFDFRGRVYPIPICLNPQGSDAIKAILEYSEGETLNQDGAAWAFAYLASLYGDDKINFDERVQRGMELIDADYKDADEPYQFLAHQLELKKVVNDPSLKFYGRIHLDACNSGSQFTSAITGDKDGCLATNVIPTINTETGLCDRKDAYLLVADISKTIINERLLYEEDPDLIEELKFFKDLMDKNGRKICKTPVMVSNYGGTAGGRADILWNMFREMKVDRKFINRSTSSRFSSIIGAAIKGVLKGGKAFEIYVQKMNNIIAKQNKPIWWTTSDGFHVVHTKNKELKSKRVTCLLPGSRKKTTIIKKIYSRDVSVTKMRSAISPNYIHALDAELLRRVALRMFKEGIKGSDWIHDSFGCHPNYVTLMLDITKEEFLKLIKKSPLRVLDEELRSQMKSRKKKDIQALEKINMPQLRGFNISGDGLNTIMESEWFFS